MKWIIVFQGIDATLYVDELGRFTEHKKYAKQYESERMAKLVACRDEKVIGIAAGEKEEGR